MTGASSGRRTRTIAGIAIAVAVAAGAWTLWRVGPGDQRTGLLVEADPSVVEAGRPIYARHCASCHGENLQGEPDWRQRKASGRLPAPPHDDSGHTWHHPDELLFAITKQGMKPPIAPEGYQSDMPGFAGALRDEEIRAVLAFIASRWSPENRAHQARLSRPR